MHWFSTSLPHSIAPFSLLIISEPAAKGHVFPFSAAGQLYKSLFVLDKNIMILKWIDFFLIAVLTFFSKHFNIFCTLRSTTILKAFIDTCVINLS